MPHSVPITSFVSVFSRLGRLSRWPALGLAAALPLLSQTKPAAPAENPEIITLTPFEVTASKDVGYLARNTLAGSRLNTSLRDVASQISVMTPEFLSDVAATTLDDAMRYSLNYENPFEFTNATANNGDFHRGIIQDNAATRTRSLVESVYMHDFFTTYMPMDTYNTERFTSASGPNAILFGLGSAAGAIDSSFKRARINADAYELSLRVDSESSYRATLDINQSVGDKLAFRFVTLQQNLHTYREPNNNKADRKYITASWQPFKDTRVRAWFEDATLLRQIARNAIIVDRATPWLALPAGSQAYNNRQGSYVQPASTNPVFQNNGNQGVTYIFGQTAGAVPVISWRNASVLTRGAEAIRPSPDNVDATLADPTVFPFDVNYQGNATNNDTYSDIGGFSIEQTVFDKLYIEAAYNREAYQANFSDFIRGVETELYVDANQYLPNSTTVNPNYGRYFIEGSGRAGIWRGNREDMRLSFSYELDLAAKVKNSWAARLAGTHRLLGLFSREDMYGGTSPQLTLQGYDAYVINGGVATGPVADNVGRLRSVRFRAYLDNPRDPASQGIYHANLPFYAFDNTKLPDGTEIATVNNPYGATGSANLSLTRMDSQVFATQSYFLDKKLVLTYGWRQDKQRQSRVTTARVGAAPDGLFQHVADLDPGENWTLYDKGISRSFGVVAHPFPWLSLFYSKSDTFAPTGTTHYPDDTLIPGAKGEGKDYGFTLNLLGDKLYFRANKYENTSGPNSSAFRDSIRDLFINIETVIHRRFPADIDGVYNPLNPRDYYNVTSDAVATGYEFELTANPKENWRISMNASKPDSTESNIGTPWLEALERRLPTWRKYADEFIEGSTTRTVRDVFRDGINNLNTMKQSDGTATQQLRTWRLNFITRYTFRDGPLKNFYVGGNYSWRGKSVLGYKNKTITNEYDFPGITANVSVPDLAEPIYGRALTTLDGMAGYSRKIMRDRVKWTVQLNIRNLLDDNGEIVQRVFSDGATRFYTIPEPRQFILTNTFAF